MKQILIVYFFLLSLNGFSQISSMEYDILKKSIPKETCVLTANSTVFLAGEYLYYKTVLLNNDENRFSSISKIAYIELVGIDSNLVFKHKLKINNSSASGDFFIPSSIKSGHYKLISYTNWSQNNLINSFNEKDIFIINPFQSDNQIVSSESQIRNQNITKIIKNDSIVFSDDKTSNSTWLSIDQLSYKSREKVSLQIKPNSNLNSINILSVRKVDSVSIVNPPIKSEVEYKHENYYLPELRGEIISGYLEAKAGNSIKDITVSLSFSSSNPIYKNAVTNENGQFYFIVNGSYNESLNFQVQDVNRENYNILINSKEFYGYSQMKFNSLSFRSSLKEWLEQESINNQIENAYFSVKTDSIIPNKSNKDFYDSIETVFNLDDYTRFKTIRETFVEIITTASLTKKDTSYVFNVPDLANIDFNRDLNYLAPLVLVDGILIQDNQDIANYNPNDIKSISTVTGQYIYGDNLYKGIISFKTYKGDFSIKNESNYSKNIEYPSIQPNKNYYKPDYDNNSNLKRIPDYRKQLLWIPNLMLSNNSTISFYTSDNKGVYEILLQAITSNGDITNVKKYFTVN